MFLNAFLLGISQGIAAEDFDRQREAMVIEQLQARGIKDKRVLEGMRKVKRHLFVPPRQRALAYSDSPLPIEMGQTISQPYIVALMTELLELKGNEKVLEIGTGSGYQTAILGELAREVYTIEILEPLAKSAERLLEKLGYRNIRVKCGDGFLGWLQKAPFEAIIVTCASPEIPPPLIAQLADPGRLVIPVGTSRQELKLVKKIKGEIIPTDIIPVRFVPILRGEMEKTEEQPEAQGVREVLKRHVKVLSQDIGERNFSHHQNLERSADYIKQELKKYNYSIEEQIYYLEGKPYRNIIATKRGTSLSEKIFIICAHYDSVIGSPGADDNASGVAGLLELARLLSQDNFNKTLKFIAFTNEEPPFFMSKDMGSFRYAKAVKKRRDNILGGICLESIGYYSDKKGSQLHPFPLSLFYPDKGNFIGLISNISSRLLLKRITREFKAVSRFPLEYLFAPNFFVPAISFSDHWSFWRFGYPAVMLTDTAFYRNPFYHTPADTYEKLNYPAMAEVVIALSMVIESILNDP